MELDATALTLWIFAGVYVAMMLGRIPGLALDRSGAALLGAIGVIATGAAGSREAWQAVDVPTVALLFSFMVISAQFRLAGFYTYVTRRVAALDAPPERLLFYLIFLAGGLSALLANDIVCLAATPVLIETLYRRGLHPLPFLLALACAANIGSAATLIGNPQNMLIGQTLRLDFTAYLALAAVPSALGLMIVWWWVIRATPPEGWRAPRRDIAITAPAFNPWQAAKGIAVLVLAVGAFLFTAWPREVAALAAAGALLLSRKMSSREMLGLVDWRLIILFMGLFVVNHAAAKTGFVESSLGAVAGLGLDIRQPEWMFVSVVALSNLVSNVPAVMLLLPAADGPLAGPILALASTLAGNLFVAGSIANIIVIDQAARLGVSVTWKDHLKIGGPVTLFTLALTALWLWAVSTAGLV